MEHLFDRQPAEIVSIPYLCQQTYDGNGGSFDEYPALSGWDLRALARDDFQGRTEAAAASFLQSWLYFGLLWEFFSNQKEFDLQHFVRQAPDGAQVVSTEHLPAYIIRWKDIEANKKICDRRVEFNRTRSRLISVYNVACDFCPGFPVNSRTDYHRPRWQLPDDIALSIQLLADTLQHAGFQIYRDRYNIEWGHSPLLVRKMRGDGWCPRAIATCLDGQQIQLLCYASTLGPPPVSKDHRECNEKRCFWEQIDLKTYKTQHKSSCSGCSSIGPDQDELTSIYEKEELPLFRLDAASQRWQVAGTKESGAYIAISHVWADGLGNLNDNKLPFCQLEDIQRMVDGLQPQRPQSLSFWWCDTLCIPVGAQNERFRRRAIEDMRWTYLKAAMTLILDAELKCASVYDSPMELYIRLKLSSWARRLWTFQESNLSRHAVLQLKDGVMPLANLYEAIQLDALNSHRPLYTRYALNAHSLFTPLLWSQEKEDRQQPNFFGIWRQLECRATSRQTDEAVGLTTLMRGDAADILRIPDTELARRMAEFFTKIGIVPLGVVFQPPPRIQLQGFRWAPATFLRCFRDEPLSSFRVVHETGMVMRNRGLVIRKNTAVQVNPKSNESFQWGRKTFTFTIGNGSLLKGLYGAVYAFKGDWEAAKATGIGRTGRPILILLLPASRDGVIACILAEEKPAEDIDNEGFHVVDFVGIVTIEPISEKGEEHLDAVEVPPQPWLLR